MDLSARVQELVAALSAGDSSAFLAERLRVDAEGQRTDRDGAQAWLAKQKPAPVQATVVGVKRNLTFLDWVWPGVGHGVAVLSWDQDGRVTHAMVQKR